MTDKMSFILKMTSHKRAADTLDDTHLQRAECLVSILLNLLLCPPYLHM